LEREGIVIAERIPIVMPVNPHDEKYLETKKTKMSHLI
jgi:GTP cyclohydrolase II